MLDVFMSISTACVIFLLSSIAGADRSLHPFSSRPQHLYPLRHRSQQQLMTPDLERHLGVNQMHPSVRFDRNAEEDVFDDSGPWFLDEHLPWSCGCSNYWRDLGEGFFPRFIRDGECRRHKCWYGHFECIPKRYAVSVLRYITEQELEIGDFGSQPFGQNYVFTAINVTVSCSCGNT
ncbi:hypothetical protein DPMN_118917 [Dreissena polymorpha]|uniref:Uncharacterized protein n=1 Tax=Dreissena polymorpha TaxID=45954 RepID=A0A9D4JQR1_DREPO|nr:hypothetical protein DPMN_118917 [Dreissena polymorpha]